MTDRTVIVRTADLAWVPVPNAPGLFTKVLRTRPGGGRTALQRIDTNEGYMPPTRAHFHNVYEEIMCVKGAMSFDSVMWLEPVDYVYHPPRTVHGFMSALKEEAWFLSRVGGTLDFNYIDEPLAREAYAVGRYPETRPLVYAPQPLGSEQGGDGVKAVQLSVDAASGAGSRVVELPAGAGYDPGGNQYADVEFFVVTGAVTYRGNHLEEGTFVFSPGRSAEAEPLVAAAGGAVVYVTVLPKEDDDA